MRANVAAAGDILIPALGAENPRPSDAIEQALNQTPEEGRRRMRALRRQVLVHDVDRWARSFLDALAATRTGEEVRSE